MSRFTSLGRPVPIVCLMLAPAAAFAQQGANAPAPSSAIAPTAPASSPAKTVELVEPPIQEVVVTASKRRERQQDAATAITTLTGETLEKLNVERFQDYVSLVPNLEQVGGDGGGFGTVVLRGMYTGAQQLTNTTGFYLGETPMTASGSLGAAALTTPDPDLVEISRIEVLKGPQGTLFGASSLGGLIRIIPREADVDDFSFNARIGASVAKGGDGGYETRASINVPISKGLLGLQMTAFDRQTPGFTTNTETGAEHQGRSDAGGGSISGRLAVNRQLDVNVRFLSQTMKQIGIAGQDDVTGTTEPNTGERQYASAINSHSGSDYDLGEISTEWRPSAGVLTAVLSNARTHSYALFDYTPVYADFLRSIIPASYLPASFILPAPLSVKMDKTTAEVRFAANRIGAFEYLVGGFATRESDQYDVAILGDGSDGQSLPGVLGNFLTSNTLSAYKEAAVFGDATYYLTNDLDIGAGARYAKNKQEATLVGSGLLAGAGGSESFPSTGSKTTYQATLRWRPDTDFSTYARIATGYRPGGPQTNPTPIAGVGPTFSPDTVTNYELGAKGKLLGGRMAYDAAIYHVDWKDMQLNALSGGALLTGNAGKATVDGIELQGTVQATHSVTIGANAGYNRAVLRQIADASSAALGAVAGDQLPGTPHVTFSSFGDYYFQTGGRYLSSVGATVRYQGTKVSNFSNDPTNPLVRVPSYTQFDLRAAVQWDVYTLRFYIDNITDRNGYTSYSTSRVLASSNVPSSASLVAPRTVGFSLGVAL